MTSHNAATNNRRRKSQQDRHDPSSLIREEGLSLSQRIERLVNEMHFCIQENRPINLSNPPHREITEALHQLVYEKTGEETTLDIIYNDMPSDQKRPRNSLFAVRALWLPPEKPTWNSGVVQKKQLNIGTLSFRHVDYDDFVDLYILRDRETRLMNSMEIEEEAFSRMTEILNDPYLSKESYLSIYQTGLEPLVVGVYRAIVSHLKDRRKQGLPYLFVRSVFFAKKGAGESSGKNYWG